MSSPLALQVEPSPLQQLDFPLLQQKQISIYVKRDDLLHPLLSGNKWRKLKYNLLQREIDRQQTFLTFGGAYSNHLHAFAAACQLLQLRGVAVVRGERPAMLGPTLQFVAECGVQLEFVSREQYRQRDDEKYLQTLRARFARCEIIPEGGSNALALRGVAEIHQELGQQLPAGFDYLACAVGSGGTLAGLIADLQPAQRALGICVLKGADYLRQQIAQLAVNDGAQWQLNHDYHFGGYARFDSALLDFMVMFQQRSAIPLEPIYTGKLLYALFDLVAKDYFAPGTRIVALHSGGLQGLEGMRQCHAEIRERL